MSIATKLRTESGETQEIQISTSDEFKSFADKKAEDLVKAVTRKQEIEAEIARRHEELQNQINAEFGEEYEAIESEEASIREEVSNTMKRDAWKSYKTENGVTFTMNDGKFTFDPRVARAEMSDRTFNRVRKNEIDVKLLKNLFPGIARRAMVQGDRFLSVRGL